MTQTQALKLALEALELSSPAQVGQSKEQYESECSAHYTALRAVRDALAQPEQEPVDEPQPDGVVLGFTDDGKAIVDHDGLEEGWVLYTTPPQRKPLTDEEIWDEVKAADLDWQTGWSLDEDAPNRYTTFARAIEAAHGIKE